MEEWSMERRNFSHFTIKTPSFFTRLRDFLDRLVGCWHSDLSRPFTVNNETYRVCLCCGARRPFVAESWMNTGTFYRETIPQPVKVQVQAQQPVVVVARVHTEINETAPYQAAA